MAHTVTIQTLEQGPRYTTIKATIAGDSKTATELTNQVLLDASSYSTKTNNNLLDIEYDLNGFSATLFWDATSDVQLMSLGKDHPYKESYLNFGGLPNPNGTGTTGDILMTTNGLASTAYTGHIILRVKWKD